MTDKKHVHKLKKVKYKSGSSTYFCVLPDCTFKINPSLALGKRSICWRCGEEFILNEYSLRLVRPHCSACHKIKNDKLNRIEIGKEFETPLVIKEMTSLAEKLKREIEERKEDI